MIHRFCRDWLPGGLRRALRRRLMGERGLPVSAQYRRLDAAVPLSLLRGWQEPEVAARQQAAFDPILQDMRAGRPRDDFRTLAEAVRLTGLSRPRVIEIGCGGGWNFEVLTALMGRPVAYLGVDYSASMVALARLQYPSARFVIGDALSLPFSDAVCDVLLSGTVLMHLSDHVRAIQESRRVSCRWCIFHTVPVVTMQPTLRLSKLAYGQRVFEVIFNETELLGEFQRQGIAVRASLPSIAYDAGKVTEGVHTVTYVCEIA